MRISLTASLSYHVAAPCSLLLQIEAAAWPDQQLIQTKISVDDAELIQTISGEDGFGKRHWFRANGLFKCDYHAEVLISRADQALAVLPMSPVATVPGDVVKYLMSSRYCHPEDFYGFVGDTFGHLQGGQAVQAMSDWVYANFTYDNAASTSSTTATDSFTARRGVCRDYAHVLIAMVRAIGIPARFVSAYAPEVVPQDFHAVVEVYLDHDWHLIDPTGMASPSDIVRIGVGRDAVDTAFLTSYGPLQFCHQQVQVQRLS